MRWHQPGVLAFLLIVAAPLPAADERTPVPEAEAQARAEKVIKDLFKADYARKRPADMLELSTKLLDQVEDAADQPAVQFVLLREALALTAQAGELEQALRLADSIASRFQVSPNEWRAAAFEKAAPGVATVDGNKALAESALQAVAEAVADDDFDAAERLLRVADGAARRCRINAVLGAVAAQLQETARVRREFDRVKVARAALQKDARDPAANLVAGKYYCFLKDDWETGLPLLAQAGDDPLRTAAARDQANPTTATAKVETADAWYDLAAGQEAAVRPIIQLRALYWYEKAIGQLSGLAKTRVEKRIAELEKVALGRYGLGTLFTAIRAGIKENQTQSSPIYGGGKLFKVPFKEVPASGAVLIGFHYTLRKGPAGKDLIDELQPIFLTRDGERLGQLYGQVAAGTKLTTVKARPGYAVGALTIRTGLAIDGFALTFMKLSRQGLQKDDSYKSDHVGGMGGMEHVIGGDGALVVGILGRKNPKGGWPGGLGLVLLPVKDKE
jgi:hypothetical protein